MRSLRVLRELLNEPAGRLAARAGVSRTTLTRIEHGKLFPSKETLVAIDKAFLDLIAERAAVAGANDNG